MRATKLVQGFTAGALVLGVISAPAAASAAARDALAAQMQTALTGAEFGGKPVSGATANKLIAAGRALLGQAVALAHE